MGKDLIKFDKQLDLRKIGLKEAWDLRDQLDDVADVIDEFIDDEIQRLVKEGWTQTRIAKEVGRSQQAVSRRMARIGIEPIGKAGRPRITRASNSEPIEVEVEVDDDDEDEEEIEPVVSNGHKKGKKIKKRKFAAIPKLDPKSESDDDDDDDDEDHSDEIMDRDEPVDTWEPRDAYMARVMQPFADGISKIKIGLIHMRDFDRNESRDIIVRDEIERLENLLAELRKRVED